MAGQFKAKSLKLSSAKGGVRITSGVRESLRFQRISKAPLKGKTKVIRSGKPKGVMAESCF